MRNWLFRQDLDQISSVTGLSTPIVLKVMNGMKRPGIMQLNQLRLVKGIGIKTLEKLFYIAQQEIKKKEHNEQQEKDPVQLVLDIS